MENENKRIEWVQEFGKLFPDHTDRVLKDNHKWCPKCDGIGFIRKGNYIEVCSECHGIGMIELCAAGCGRDRGKYYNLCDECYEKHQKEEAEKRKIANFEKATKIPYSEYDGKFLVDGCDTIMEKDDFEEWLYEKITDCEGEGLPEFVYAAKSYNVLDIDLCDIVCGRCEDDGYEDQFSFLNTDGLNPIQELLDKWIESQGESAYVYQEDRSKIILIDDIVQEIANDIEAKAKQ